MTSGMPAGKSLLDRLRGRFEIFISGRAPDDPLYLTNRTWRQKVKIASLIAAPVVLLIALVTIGASDLFRLHRVDPYGPPPAEAPLPAVTRELLPDPVSATTDLEVVNIRIARNTHPPVVTGTVRNKTDRNIVSAEVSYYLANTKGNLVGTDTTDVANVGPHGSVKFRMALKIADAEYVFVRDAHPK